MKRVYKSEFFAKLKEYSIHGKHQQNVPAAQHNAQVQNKKLHNRRRNKIADVSRKQNRN